MASRAASLAPGDQARCSCVQFLESAHRTHMVLPTSLGPRGALNEQVQGVTFGIVLNAHRCVGQGLPTLLLVMYLELRFNRYIRLCGTVLFIVQTGGLKAVVWTDVFQVGIMVAGFASVIIQAALIQGGIGRILNDAYSGGRLNFWNFNPNPLQRHTFWTIIIGGTFTWTSIYGVNQSQVQRYIACKSRFQAKLSLYVNLVGLWAILTCSVFCGLALYSRYRDCDPWTAKKVSAEDQLMPYLVLDIFRDYPGVPGLFVACAYSGTLSTVSSSINALAAVTVEDLIRPYFRSLSERSLSWISQGMSVLFGVLCLGMAALASLMGALLQAALSIIGMIGGPLLGLFSLGILVPFANSVGAFVGLLAGFSISLWTGVGAQLYPPLPERTMPLHLATHGCNSTDNGTTLVTATEMPFSTGAFEIHNAERTPLMSNWYSLSYLYFSTVGTLTTLFVGILLSLSTGGRKQNLDPKFLLTKEDFLSNFDIFKKEDHVLSYKSHPAEGGGADNPAFSPEELSFPDQSGKVGGTRL
ncbi:Sodium-coupled monocarboxylate transporter 1 [Fukomys damarensis]|uniref:Sodium-coupled monocarboxylate transporter 1 n=1 Tax=Fukomys damarensis TaxID=885580 RepID=A0A091DJ61_FUKDA|nr:Sodium-coupled monocarboxylate transporter 1 [Fukomys damarensis]